MAPRNDTMSVSTAFCFVARCSYCRGKWITVAEFARVMACEYELQDGLDPKLLLTCAKESHQNADDAQGHLDEEDNNRQARFTDIQVFRHPLFIKGDWRRCAAIQKYGTMGTSGVDDNNGRDSSLSITLNNPATRLLSADAAATRQSPEAAANFKRQQAQL
jgi:hypothetical protein